MSPFEMVPDPDELEPGFYHAKHSVKKTEAYFQLTEDRKTVLVYGNGEVHRNDASQILIREDILRTPAVTVEAVDIEETPFADDVEPRADGEPDPVVPVGDSNE